ncbi:MAG TPA: 16S rRNA (adenine(1518)-N(6)/adenine(1519)-N(6))-dimethyltransferase RsmA, partial [Polyangia bacterium]
MSDVGAEVRGLLGKYGLRPKHGLGQNFLVGSRVFDQILAAIALLPEDWVVEVGAGLGTLTKRILTAVPDGRVVALERDAAMHQVLGTELAGYANLELWLGDAVEFDLAAVAARAGRPIIVAGNLPYQISSPMLRRLEEGWRFIRRAVFMLQREVAARLVAAAGSDDYGSLSVMLPLHYDVRLVTRVGRTAFIPSPKVESAVVLLEA